MRGTITIPVKNIDHLADQLCRWSRKEKYSIVLRSNGYNFSNPIHDSLSNYQILAAFGAEEIISPELNHFQELADATNQNDWLFGYLGYDLKNQIEKLNSENPDGTNLPEMLFFRPSIVLALKNNSLNIHYSISTFNSQTAGSLFDAIMAAPTVDGINDSVIKPVSRFTKNEYLKAVNDVLTHLQRGDIYEMNLCQEFYAKPCKINPYETYINLNRISPTPFSAFGKFHDKFLLCASPERFLLKKGNIIVSQPIKGTCPKGLSEEEDKQLREKLKNDPKERAENIMIVDLVRNDLSRVAKKGTVKVDELCEVYPFAQVNQMISTVSCEIDGKYNAIDLLKATFPMGSMTGAPKVSAMRIIEKYERSKRGLYSGAVGYIDPQGNFDFNVVIRSLIYNKTKSYLSYTVGGAITQASIPENEYNECILKAKAITELLTNKTGNEEKV